MKIQGKTIIICLIICNVLFYTASGIYLGWYMAVIIPRSDGPHAEFILYALWMESLFFITIGYVLLYLRLRIGRWLLLFWNGIMTLFFVDSVVSNGILWENAPCLVLWGGMFCILLWNKRIKAYIDSRKRWRYKDSEFHQSLTAIINSDGMKEVRNFINPKKWSIKKICCLAGFLAAVLLFIRLKDSRFSMTPEKHIIYHAIETTGNHFKVRKVGSFSDNRTDYELKGRKNAEIEDYVEVIRTFNEYIGRNEHFQDKKYQITFSDCQGYHVATINSSYLTGGWKLNKLRLSISIFEKISQIEPFSVLDLETLDIPLDCMIDDITVLEKFPELEDLTIFANLTEEQEAYVKDILPNCRIRIGDRIVSE